MAALLMDDIRNYADFVKRCRNYKEESIEDPLEKLEQLADNKYWKWHDADRLDSVISTILSRTKEIDRRLNQNDNALLKDRLCLGADFRNFEVEPFLLPEVIKYVAAQKSEAKVKSQAGEGEKVYDQIRQVLK